MLAGHLGRARAINPLDCPWQLSQPELLLFLAADQQRDRSLIRDDVQLTLPARASTRTAAPGIVPTAIKALVFRAPTLVWIWARADATVSCFLNDGLHGFQLSEGELLHSALIRFEVLLKRRVYLSFGGCWRWWDSDHCVLSQVEIDHAKVHLIEVFLFLLRAW